LDYLKNRAKSGDMAVLELTFRNVWESGRKIDSATGVSPAGDWLGSSKIKKDRTINVINTHFKRYCVHT